MKKVFKIIFVAVFGFLSFFINNNKVFAYLSNTQSISNNFTIAPTYTDTFIVNHEDMNGVVTELKRDIQIHFENAVVSIDEPTGVDLTNYLLDSITLDGTGSYSIGDTFNQGTSDRTVVYTYKDILHSVAYQGDTANYTYSNTNTSVVHNSTYTSTLVPATGRDINTVTVTMGGTTLSNVYDATNKAITINQVTDDIQINVTTKVKEYTITYNGNNFTHSNNATTIEHGSSFTTRITAANNYTITDGSVTMGGNDITNTAYNTNNNRITINNVTGDIVITIETEDESSGGGGNFPCLVEGTKVTLYDGTTKNIEDITYNDLIKVWNHDTGSFDYEYAGWIESKGTASSYTKITFEDGTELKVVGSHSLFSKRLNKYVDILSRDLEVGDEVVTLKDGIGYIKITNIEKVNETVHFYHVITTRYFNLIANDILTTFEIFENISNFMGFDENLKWQNVNEVRSDMYTYDDFTYLPKYIYKVFRLEETKYLVNSGLVTPDQFTYLFDNFLTNNDKMLMPQTNEEGTRLWMVTTSDDTDLSNERYLLEEGSIYTVPTPNNQEGFVRWYNSSDNKYYMPGDTIEVYGGMHLTAIYE